MTKKIVLKGLSLILSALFTLPTLASEIPNVPVVTFEIQGELQSHQYLQKDHFNSCIQNQFKDNEQVKFVNKGNAHLSLNVAV